MIVIVNSANGKSVNFDVGEWDSLLSLARLHGWSTKHTQLTLTDTSNIMLKSYEHNKEGNCNKNGFRDCGQIVTEDDVELFADALERVIENMERIMRDEPTTVDCDDSMYIINFNDQAVSLGWETKWGIERMKELVEVLRNAPGLPLFCVPVAMKVFHTYPPCLEVKEGLNQLSI
jgi:hypothetical protein